MWHFYSTFYHNRTLFWLRLIRGVWGLLEWLWKNREATINLSDLISFLLVTPEIAHRLSRSDRVQAIFHYSGILLFIPFLVAGAFFGFDNSRDGLYFIGFGVTCILFTCLYLGAWFHSAFLTPFTREQATVRRTDRVMLVIGMALFVASRLAAIIGALDAEPYCR